MFGIFADLLSSAFTILLPIFASYKALRSSDPSQLAPWLMYWVVLSAILLVESWTVFIIGWFPFYSWIRLFCLCYLVLPQTQGARMLYQQYVDPFLAHHEREIEVFIVRSHERAKTLGLQYLYRAIDLIREKVLGLPPQSAAFAASAPPSSSSSSGPAAYAQSFLSRFSIPIAGGSASSGGPRAAPQPAGNDWYSTLSSAVAALTSTGQSHDARAEELSASGNLLPRELESMSRADKQKFISNQRDVIEVLRSALAREERNLGTSDGEPDEHLAYGGSGGGGASAPLKKNRSENSFDHIEHEDTRDRPAAGGRSTSGGWGGWFSGEQQQQQQHQSGASSGVEFATRAVDEIASRSRGSGH